MLSYFYNRTTILHLQMKGKTMCREIFKSLKQFLLKPCRLNTKAFSFHNIFLNTFFFKKNLNKLY